MGHSTHSYYTYYRTYNSHGLLSYYTVKYKCTFIDLEKKISAIVAVEPLMPTFTPDQYENEVC